MRTGRVSLGVPHPQWLGSAPFRNPGSISYTRHYYYSKGFRVFYCWVIASLLAGVGAENRGRFTCLYKLCFFYFCRKESFTWLWVTSLSVNLIELCYLIGFGGATFIFSAVLFILSFGNAVSAAVTTHLRPLPCNSCRRNNFSAFFLVCWTIFLILPQF